MEHSEVQEYNNSWDYYFMKFAQMGSTRSKDPSTKVGACIVKNKKVLSIGYNGAPKGFPDDLVPTTKGNTFPLIRNKYAYVCHAEPNAILNYGGSILDFENSKLYVLISPCHECAKLIIQAGIKEVIYREEYHNSETWEMSKYLFDKCGVKYRKLEEE